LEERESGQPKLPKTQNDIALEEAWTETTAGETFVLNDDTHELGQRILILATDSNLMMLCDSDSVWRWICGKNSIKSVSSSSFNVHKHELRCQNNVIL
jgi:hypothetical protein